MVSTVVGGGGGFGVEFMTDAPMFEVYLRGAGGRGRIMVDGEVVAADQAFATGEAVYRWLVDFTQGDYAAEVAGANNATTLATILAAARMPRFIEIEIDANYARYSAFRGITVGPRDAVWIPTHIPLGPRWAMMGDSWLGKGEGPAGYLGWAALFGRLAGIRDLYRFSLGGTGWIKNNGTSPPYKDRTAELIACNPDGVIIIGSINDTGGAGNTDYINAVDSTLGAIRAACPDIPIVTMGVMYYSGSPSASVIQNRDIIRERTEQYGGHFIDPIGGPYPYSGSTSDYTNKGPITGTGSTDNVQSSGNASLYIGTTHNHLNQAGNEFYARWFASQFAALRSSGLIGLA
jgi:hypothetical protein